MIQNLLSTPLSSIEIIGEGLGAHVAGYAGQRLNGTLGRIKGLSPARLFFDGLPNKVKLDRTDAQVVQIIETPEATTKYYKIGYVPRIG